MDDSSGNYLVHNKNSQSVHIGIAARRPVAVGPGSPGALDRVPTLRQVEDLLVPEAPCFFVASPDIRRPFADDSIPRALFVNPGIEFTFSPDHRDGVLSYASDRDDEQRGRAMLRGFRDERPPSPPRDTGAPGSFPDLIAGWRPAESDDSFRERVAAAVDALQAHPDGKMTLTRAYERPRPAGRDPFDLYRLHARRNGEYSCSHFFRLGRNVFSLGVSPESVFELRGRELTVDVVAATCRASDNDQYVSEELLDNPKQLKEHRSALKSRQDRFRGFCKADSIAVVRPMRVKRLRNVCHLHTVFGGELLPGVTAFDLMENIFPLLGARPRELLAVADAEKAPHRYYGGLVGRTHAGTASAFLNIRNVLVHGERIHAKVGVGVLRESNAQSELLETRDKLSGLLEAVRLWEG